MLLELIEMLINSRFPNIKTEIRPETIESYGAIRYGNGKVGWTGKTQWGALLVYEGDSKRLVSYLGKKSLNIPIRMEEPDFDLEKELEPVFDLIKKSKINAGFMWAPDEWYNIRK